jgi:hypothetical protein
MMQAEGIGRDLIGRGDEEADRRAERAGIRPRSVIKQRRLAMNTRLVRRCAFSERINARPAGGRYHFSLRGRAPKLAHPHLSKRPP